MKSPISIKEAEIVFKTLSLKKFQDQEGFLENTVDKPNRKEDTVKHWNDLKISKTFIGWFSVTKKYNFLKENVLMKVRKKEKN